YACLVGLDRPSLSGRDEGEVCRITSLLVRRPDGRLSKNTARRGTKAKPSGVGTPTALLFVGDVPKRDIRLNRAPDAPRSQPTSAIQRQLPAKAVEPLRPLPLRLSSRTQSRWREILLLSTRCVSSTRIG